MAEEFFSRIDFRQAADMIQARTRHKPSVGIVLGSGLNSLADDITQADSIPYRVIPHFPVSTVEGHAGELVIGRLSGKTVLAMRGRSHYYEGYSMQRVTLPIRVMQELGIRMVVITNAAGGVNSSFQAGDIMLITDQINLVGMTGLNPLRGPNDETLGPRFQDMTAAYDQRLGALAKECALESGLDLKEGVYMMLVGPSFESPADIRFVRAVGADAVGMSTVPEVIVARHGGMQVLGLSLISNSLIAGHDKVTHDEVLAAGLAAAPKLANLIKAVLSKI